MVQIIGISGRKQSGKNTVANYINGCILSNLNMVKNFHVGEDGLLQIETINQQTSQSGWGIFDVARKDETFTSYAEENLWPFVKLYHFADPLKKMCVELFGLTPQQVYGTDEDKNSETDYDMTSREFLQYFGTDVMRKIKDDVWVQYTINTIKQEGPLIAIIPDVRFPNEVSQIKKAGGTVIRLTRDVFNDDHSCEKALDKDVFDWSEFDYVIENESTVSDLLTKIETLQYLWSNINANYIR